MKEETNVSTVFSRGKAMGKGHLRRSSGNSEGPSYYLSERPLNHTRRQKPGQPDS